MMSHFHSFHCQANAVRVDARKQEYDMKIEAHREQERLRLLEQQQLEARLDALRKQVQARDDGVISVLYSHTFTYTLCY